jgi:hypothetical protein
MAACHLAGRLPHGEVDAMLTDAVRARTAEDVEGLRKRAAHIARVFSAVVRDFRATVPRGERKRGVGGVGGGGGEAGGFRVPVGDDWRPVASAFATGCPPECERARELTLAQWRDEPLAGYDRRPSALISLLAAGRLATLRRMVDGGVDLRRFWRLTATSVGGGLNLLLESAEACLWLNQALLLGVTAAELAALLAEQRVQGAGGASARACYSPWEAREGDPRRARLLAAQAVVAELSDCYDNRDHRRGPAGLRGLDVGCADAVRAALRDAHFPLLYRGAHMCLYNEVRHHGAPLSALEDAAHVDEGFDAQLEGMVEASLVGVLCTIVRPIHGHKRRDLFHLPPGYSSRVQAICRSRFW